MIIACWVSAACLCSEAVHADNSKDAPLVVVYPVDCVGKDLSKTLCAAISDRVMAAIAASGVYQVVDRAHRDKILAEQKECRKDVYAKECRLEVGRLLSAKRMIQGRLTLIENKDYQLSLTMTGLVRGDIKRIRTSSCDKCGKKKLLKMVAKYAKQFVIPDGVGPGRGTGTVYFAVRPGGAGLTIDQTRYGILPGGGKTRSVRLTPGRHNIVIKKSGFRVVSRAITIKAGQVETVKETLRSIPRKQRHVITSGKGMIDVKSLDATTGKEIQGATIFLDGSRRPENTPRTLTKVPSGPHEVEVKHPMYHPHHAVVNVKSDDVASVVVRLKRNFGSIKIQSTPAGATVHLNGRPQRQPTPFSAPRIESKAYKVVLKMNGYHDDQFQVYVSEGQTTSKARTLRPAHGKLVITTSPPGATIKVDGVKRGKSPLSLPRIDSGAHVVQVTLKEHFPGTEKVVVRDGETTTKHFALATRMGMVSMTSAPDGAKVFVDGRSRGVTPVRLKLPHGKHQIKVSKKAPPHHDFTEELSVAAAREHTVHARLEPRMGAAILISNPPGASLAVDGKTIGITPKKISSLFMGTHQYTMKKKGVTTRTGRFAVREGQTVNVEETLSKLPDISVRCTPDGADVLLDGRRMGQSPTVLKEVSPGAHTVECKLAGYASARGKVEARAGARATVELALSKTAFLTSKRRKKNILGYTSLGLGLACAVTAAVMYGVGASSGADAHDGYMNTTVPDEIYDYRQDIDAARTKMVVGHVLAGAAVAAIGFSVYQFISRPELPQVSNRDTSIPSIGIAPTAGGGTLVLGGRF